MTKPATGHSRNLSVRLPEDSFQKVVALARVDNITMGEVIRRAIASYHDTRTKESDFPEKVVELQRALESLLPPR